MLSRIYILLWKKERAPKMFACVTVFLNRVLLCFVRAQEINFFELKKGPTNFCKIPPVKKIRRGLNI